MVLHWFLKILLFRSLNVDENDPHISSSLTTSTRSHSGVWAPPPPHPSLLWLVCSHMPEPAMSPVGFVVFSASTSSLISAVSLDVNYANDWHGDVCCQENTELKAGLLTRHFRYFVCSVFCGREELLVPWTLGIWPLKERKKTKCHNRSPLKKKKKKHSATCNLCSASLQQKASRKPMAWLLWGNAVQCFTPTQLAVMNWISLPR